MAVTEKKNTIKYKFGQLELDMLKYIENIGYNVQSYLEDRIKNRGWTDDQVQEFSTAYNRLMGAFKLQLTDGSNRFSTNDLGVITDSLGEFSNVDDDGIDLNGSQYYYNDKGERITTTDYNLLKDKKKKKYKTFNANRQVAEYFRIIGNKLKDKPRPETSKFSLDKHGFVAWWNRQYNPAGEKPNLIPFLNKDPVGANGKRPVNNRAKMAAGWMNEYLDWLKDLDLDYSNYDQFKDYDTYAAKGKALAAKWGDGKWDSDDLIEGQAFGISNDFSEGFFTQDEKPYLTEQQREEIDSKRKEEEELKRAEEEYKKELRQEEQIKLARLKWVDDAARIFNSKYSGWYSQKNPNHLYFNRSLWYTNNGKINESKLFSSWGSGYLNLDGTLNSNRLSQYMNEFLKAPFINYDNNDRVRNILSLIYANIAEPITLGKLKGMYYIPRQSDTLDYGALIYNPNRLLLFYSFIANVPRVWNELITLYLILHENLNTNAEHYFKEGGIISLQYGGDFGIAFTNKRNDYIKSKADATNTDVKTYTARNREPAGSRNALKPNNGFTANDILRLTAIGTDLAAMGLSFTPAVGAAALTGAAGTTQHLIADINEDGLDWGDVGRAALGYSLDALGIIPGTSAVTKPAKIIKTLKTFVPRLIAVVGTIGTVANAPAITKSLNKLTTDEHLTVQDWQNITSAVTLAVGGGAAAARKFHTVRGTARGLKSPAETIKDNVAILVRKKGTKDIETIILTKSETKAARNAKSNEDLLKIIQKREGMSNYELATRTSLIPSLRRPTLNNKWPMHFGQTRATLIPIKRDQKTGRIFAENGRWGADIKRENLKRISKGLHAAIQQRLSDDREIANLDIIRDAQIASDNHKWLLDNKASIISGREKHLDRVKADRDAYISAHPSVPSVTNTRRKLLDMADALAGHPGATIRRNPELTGYNAKQTVADDALLKTNHNRASRELTSLRKRLKELNNQLNGLVGKHRIPIKKQIADIEQEIATKTLARARLKTDKLAAEDWLNRNNLTEYTNLRRLLAEALRYERGLASKNAAVADAQASLDEIKNITDTPGQTEAFKKLKDMMDPSSSTIDFTSLLGTLRTVKRNWKDILKKYNIKYKLGGKFTSVRKYETGKPITNVTGTADWFTNMYSHASMQKWINDFNTNNYLDFNSLQDSWYDNLKETGYDPNNPGQAKGKSNNVLNRQKEWDKTGTNAAIKSLIDSGVLTPAGNSGDNEQSGYLDGYFGAQEYLRHGGTNNSWLGHDKELADLCKKFKEKGLEYYLDENGMYKLRLLNSDKPSENSNESSDMVPERDKKKLQNDLKNQFELVRKFNIDPMVYSIAHNAYANAANDKMTANQIDAMRKGLTLYDLKNNTKYLEGDFDALISGQQAAGQLMHLASQPLTSDGALLASTYTDSVTRALDYIRLGNITHNQALKKSKNEIWQLRYNEDNDNYNIAMNNRASIGDLIDNIANVENTHDSKEFTNNDVLWQEMMTGIKQKANKREAMEEHYALLDIENDVKYNLSEYAKQSGKPLSKDEEEAWQAVISGDKTYSELGGEDKEAQKRLLKAYINALRKASEIELDKNREYYGIPRSKYNSVRLIVTEDWYKEKPESKKEGGTLTLKDGSKITIAKIKKRLKDIDNFYKTVKDTQDRNDKAIARVDKKMYRRRDPEKRRK